MSMDQEHLNKVLDKPAIVCCRKESGSVLGASDLEDPDIFPDLEDSGLLKIPANCIAVSKALGAKLLKTVDSLTPLTSDIVECGDVFGKNSTSSLKNNVRSCIESDITGGYAVTKFNLKSGKVIEISDLERESNINDLIDSNLFNLAGVISIGEAIGKRLICDVDALTGLTLEHFGEIADKTAFAQETVGGLLRIRIQEGKGIDIELPLGVFNKVAKNKDEQKRISDEKSFKYSPGVSQSVSDDLEPKFMRSLKRRHFKIDKVELGDETKIDGATIYIRNSILSDCKKADSLVCDVKLDIITKERYGEYSDTIMDVQPIATKENDSKLGFGVTRVLDGVVMAVTGITEDGVQIGEFGSSDGKMDECILWGRPGSPDFGDILIKTRVVIKSKTNMTRPGPLAAHKATEVITQEIREALKKLPDNLAVSEEEFKQYRRPGKKKVAVVKEIMGQGAMHDNLILPVEPVGILGGKPNVDLGNLPIAFSPLDVLDGGIHALTCIGPASKECSRHYFREPLVLEALHDEDIDFCGVIFVGSPQINSEKFYVSERLGMIIEMLDIDGAIVGTEGFGNNHVDFASHIEQIGMRGVKVVGMSYCAVQGALVVGNKYMDAMVDNNKSKEGIENEILECNTLCHEDAIRALAMLKASMYGEEIKEAERKWNPNVKELNIEAIERTGKKINRAKTL